MFLRFVFLGVAIVISAVLSIKIILSSRGPNRSLHKSRIKSNCFGSNSNIVFQRLEEDNIARYFLSESNGGQEVLSHNKLNMQNVHPDISFVFGTLDRAGFDPCFLGGNTNEQAVQ